MNRSDLALKKFQQIYAKNIYTWDKHLKADSEMDFRLGYCILRKKKKKLYSDMCTSLMQNQFLKLEV